MSSGCHSLTLPPTLGMTRPLSECVHFPLWTFHINEVYNTCGLVIGFFHLIFSRFKHVTCVRTFFFLKTLFILFLDRGERREKERELNINVWLPLTCPLPWLGIKPVTLWFAGRCSIHWATPARAERTFFSILGSTSLCGNPTFYFHLSVVGHWVVSIFRLLWIVPLWTFGHKGWGDTFYFSWEIPRSRISGPHGHSMFNHLRNCQTGEGANFSTSLSTLIFCFMYCFTVWPWYVGAKWHLMLDSLASLMANEGDIFMCSSATGRCFLEQSLFRSFAYF